MTSYDLLYLVSDIVVGVIAAYAVVSAAAADKATRELVTLVRNLAADQVEIVALLGRHDPDWLRSLATRARTRLELLPGGKGGKA